MPLKVVHPNHYEIIGGGFVLLSSRPVFGKNEDLHTGTLTEEIALLSKSPAIIAKEKKMVDLSEAESAVYQFASRVRELVADQRIKCIMEIRGRKEPGFEIKTGESANEPNEILEIVKTAFSMTLSVAVTTIDSADLAIANDGAQTIILELGPDERDAQRDSVVNVAAETVGLINSKLGFSESDERTGDVLD